eukprot:TRINITY_DN1244_c0_g1_i2.p1 TRINITY_DN1244_c0_g1~~TRINITY_DN1244_c0_g1_i2.p1  ORF type:complete len:919 (+),score=110.27 TRINITY_DN1244_c0_g1_i2:76-2832(+)
MADNVEAVRAPFRGMEEELVNQHRHLQALNKTAETRAVAKAPIGRNDLFEVRPASLRFEISNMGRAIVSNVDVVNISASSQRLLVFAPSTPYFSIELTAAGQIAPGCAQKICVTCRPDEYRYHYDTLRLHTAQGDMLVPLHAYATADTPDTNLLPTIIDFGVGVIGNRYEKKVVMKNRLPVQFDFELIAEDSHPYITVMPLCGELLPASTATIVVRFKPMSGVTARATLTVRTSQLAMNPYICTILGSASPGVPITMPADNSARFVTARASALHQHGLVREQRLDAGGAWLAEVRRADKFDKGDVVATAASSAAGAEVEQSPQLDSMTAVNSLLTQQPERLTPSELKAVLAKLQQSRQNQVHGHTRSGSERTLLELEQMQQRALAETPQVRQRTFLHEWAQLSTKQREHELSTTCAVFGQLPPSDEQVTAIAANRQGVHKSSAPAAQHALERLRHSTCQHTCNQRQASAYVAHGSRTMEELQPDSFAMESAEWGRRGAILDRFVAAVSRCTIRIRARRRLDGIWRRLGTARSREEVAALVHSDHACAYASQHALVREGAGASSEDPCVNGSLSLVGDLLHLPATSRTALTMPGAQPSTASYPLWPDSKVHGILLTPSTGINAEADMVRLPASHHSNIPMHKMICGITDERPSSVQLEIAAMLAMPMGSYLEAGLQGGLELYPGGQGECVSTELRAQDLDVEQATREQGTRLLESVARAWYLRSNHILPVCVRGRVNTPTESSVLWLLRNTTKLALSADDSPADALAVQTWAIGSASLPQPQSAAAAGYVSVQWQPHRDMRQTALLCLQDPSCLLWPPMAGTAEAMLHGPCADDALSDSESDHDHDNGTDAISAPNFEHVCSLFGTGLRATSTQELYRQDEEHMLASLQLKTSEKAFGMLSRRMQASKDKLQVSDTSTS